MNKRILYTFVSVLMIMVLLVGCGSNGATGGDINKEKKYTIKFSHVMPTESSKGIIVDKFAALVEEYTNGQVKVEVFPSGSLYGDNEELEALMSGNVQMIAPSVTKLMSLDPRFQIIDLPFFWKSEEHLFSFWDGEHGQMLYNDLKKFNILGLDLWPNGDKHFVTKEKPMLTPDDFKGVKFRIPSGAIQERMYNLLGAAAVTIPFNETYMALQQGTVDGTENTLTNIYNQKYGEVLDYLTLVGFSRVDYLIVTNNDFWEGLPEDLRKDVRRALDDATKFGRDLAESLNVEGLEKMREEGNFEIVEMSEEQKEIFTEILQPLYEEYQDIIGKELIEAAKNLAN